METVSIIVPVYNVGKWLPQCIGSILCQSFRDFRLYLVDDGSTDGSGEICDCYAARDSRVTVIHRVNGGVSAARNAGLDVAAGEYVTFCDGDDFWEPEHLAALLSAAEGVDMVSCNYTCVMENGQFHHRTGYAAAFLDMERMEDRAAYMLEDVLSGRTGWAVWARLFRREAIREVRFCQCCENYGEDLLFVLEAALHCRRVRGSEEAHYRYRLRPGSAMAAAREKPMLEARAAGAGWLWQRLADLGPARDAIAWEILRPGLEAIPAARLPAALQALPNRDWVEERLRRVRHSPLARFCVHQNLLRYRMERWLKKYFNFH